MSILKAIVSLRRRSLSFLGQLSAFLLAASSVQAAVIYVDDFPPTAFFDGTSWARAFNRLEDAIASAQATDEIWVATGIYRPTIQLGNRAACFALKDRVQIYGGFDGSENLISERAGLFDQTILSGDINNTPENLNDDTYHVVCADATVGNAVRLDGFTITSGNANGGGDFAQGGGVFNRGRFFLSQCTIRDNQANSSGGGLANHGTLLIEHCVFRDNHVNAFGPVLGGGGVYNGVSASLDVVDCRIIKNTVDGSSHGGGLYVHTSNMCVVNCDFQGNMAGGHGGGIYTINSEPEVVNCVFRGNVASFGGGILVVSQAPKFINCSLSGNVATSFGGGLYVVSAVPDVTNCIFWKNSDSAGSLRSSQIFLGSTGSAFVNFCCVQGDPVHPGNRNINTDPRFLREPDDGGDGWCFGEFGDNDDFGDLHLQGGSRSIDAGWAVVLPRDPFDLDGDTDTAEELPVDLDGNPRRTDDPNAPNTGEGPVPMVDLGAYEGAGGDIVCQEDLGFGGPLVTLTVCGEDLTQPAATATFLLMGAPRNADSYIFVGESFEPTLFPEIIPLGTLVPNPWIKVIQRPTDSQGRFSFDVDSAVQGGVLRTFYVQVIVVQGSSLHFSNAVRIIILR